MDVADVVIDQTPESSLGNMKDKQTAHTPTKTTGVEVEVLNEIKHG